MRSELCIKESIAKAIKQCARYVVATQLGLEYVTNNLYPNMQDAANKLLAEHKK